MTAARHLRAVRDADSELAWVRFLEALRHTPFDRTQLVLCDYVDDPTTNRFAKAIALRVLRVLDWWERTDIDRRAREVLAGTREVFTPMPTAYDPKPFVTALTGATLVEQIRAAGLVHQLRHRPRPPA